MDHTFPARCAGTLCGLIVILLSTPLSAQPETVYRGGILYLKNGDFVSGRMQSSDLADVMHWKSPLFEPAIQFDVHSISHISYAPQQRNESLAVKPSNPLTRGFVKLLEQIPPAPIRNVPGTRVELLDGQVLYGEIVSLDDDSLMMESQRHGSLRVDRQALVEMDGFARTPSLLFEGSGNLALWSVLGEEVIATIGRHSDAIS